jgi:hypothetical protein
MQKPEPYDVVLMLVVDVSGSMTQSAPGTTITKWEATRDAIAELVESMPPRTAMGAVYYPNLNPAPLPHDEPTADPSECVNASALVAPDVMDDDQRARLSASLDRVYVQGGTPTHTAYQVGLDALTQTSLPGNKYMVLITDGEPTYGAGCVGNGTTLASNIKPEFIGATLESIRDAYASMPPVGTFVIGSPGSEETYSGSDARPWLSQAARDGGTAPISCADQAGQYCHFDLTSPEIDFAVGIRSALAQILGQVVACDYTPPDPGEGETLDLELIDVKMVDGAGVEYEVPRTSVSACDQGSHGWYLNADQSRVVLCPRTCGAVRQDSMAGINVYYGCTTQLT